MQFQKLWTGCNHKIEWGKRTLVMGILNVTPDSFSDGGSFHTVEKAIQRAEEIVCEGGDIIDIGGQSTRPGYIEISAEEELERLIPTLTAIRRQVTLPISVDTYYPEVAKAALACGADIINDVSGLAYPEMLDILSKTDAGYILMHNGHANTISSFFESKLSQLIKQGVSPARICLDIGIGFGKSAEECFDVIRDLPNFHREEYPMLVGCSRKRMIGEASGNPPFNQRLAGTIAAHSIAILRGANIIRVHDVAEGVQGARVAEMFSKSVL